MTAMAGAPSNTIGSNASPANFDEYPRISWICTIRSDNNPWMEKKPTVRQMTPMTKLRCMNSRRSNVGCRSPSSQMIKQGNATAE